jgi:DNA-binding response OmpR family regulator
MNLSTANILLVEDNRQMAELTRAVLMGLGFAEIEHALNGDQAMAALGRQTCDLVLLDRRLGREDGLELAKRIRWSPGRRVSEVPIVMLTGSASQQSVQAARDAGVNGYLVKPFTVVAVHDRLVAALTQKPQFIRCDSYIGPDRRHRADPDYKGPERRNTRRVGQA